MEWGNRFSGVSEILLSIFKYLFIRMTREELKNNFEFKLTEKEIKKKFPFVLEIKPSEDYEMDDSRFDYIYPIEITVDNSKLLEQFSDWSMWPFQEDLLNKTGALVGTFMSEFYYPNSGSNYNPYLVFRDMSDFTLEFRNKIHKNKGRLG